MKIFSRSADRNRLNGPLPVDPETDIYTRNFFLLRLKEERERSKRTERPFSLLVIDVASMSLALTRNSGGFSRIQEKRLIDEIVRHSRKTDIKGWFDPTRVGILMPDTKNTGALEFRQKICGKIGHIFPSGQTTRLEDFVQVFTFEGGSSTEPFSFPDGDNGGGDSIGLEEDALYADIVDRNLPSSLTRLAKRILDIVGSILGIIITFPLMLIISVLIKLTSPGPVLFRQERVGFMGRRFIFLKFRSMIANADQTLHKNYVADLINAQRGEINRGTDAQPLYKMNDDPRITPIGNLLRKTSLDELPQLFNILRGDMSLVGPRPPIPYEVEEYRLWHYGRVVEAKPGLTGLWQVSGRSRTTFDDMVRLDLQYTDRWSIWLDIKIILKTFRAVLSAKGAY